MLTEPPRSQRRRRLRGPSFSLAIPAILWYGFFFVLPILLIVWYSFGVKNTASGSTGVPVSMTNKTLQNYRDAFSPTFFTVFKSTLKISIIATTLCFVFGFPVAYFLVFKVSEKWKAIMLALIVVPSFTSFLIRTLAWRIPLAANGELSKWLQDWGVLSGPINVLDTRAAVQLAIIYNYLGFMILPLFVALDRIDHHMREASKDLGANRVPAGHPAAGRAGHCRRRHADVHPDVWRLRHGDAARRHLRKHDRGHDRQSVPCGP